jgi:hypothetical protein
MGNRVHIELVAAVYYTQGTAYRQMGCQVQHLRPGSLRGNDQQKLVGEWKG